MRGSRVVEAAIGYAAGPGGDGVAYAHLRGEKQQRLVRLTFQTPGAARLAGRADGYAALTRVANELARRGVRRVRFVLGDREFVDEIARRATSSENLVLPYVRLRCALNALADYSVQLGPTDDLTQRARAEVALNVAA